MYWNFKIIAAAGLDIEDVVLLQLCHQNKYEDVGVEIEKLGVDLDGLVIMGLVTEIKGNKKDTRYSKMRLTKNGSKLLQDINTPEVSAYDIQLFEWAEALYQRMGKKPGNKKKTKIMIAQFQAESGIVGNEFAILLRAFLSDENNMEYNHVLEYALNRRQGAYQTKFELSESRLYNYYLEHKEEFDQTFRGLKE